MAELTLPTVSRSPSRQSRILSAGTSTAPSASPSRESLDDESLGAVEEVTGMGVGPRVRCDERIHVQVKRMTESDAFNFFIIGIIFMNALTMALETEETLDAFQTYFTMLDHTFLAIYTVEFILKIYAEPKYYWSSVYNLFDFMVLVISFVNVSNTLITLL